jgi:hypothetical protein
MNIEPDISAAAEIAARDSGLIQAVLRLPNGHEYVWEDDELFFGDAPSATLLPISLDSIDTDDVPAIAPWLEAIGAAPTAPPAEAHVPAWLPLIGIYVNVLFKIFVELVKLTLIVIGAVSVSSWSVHWFLK